MTRLLMAVTAALFMCMVGASGALAQQTCSPDYPEAYDEASESWVCAPPVNISCGMEEPYFHSDGWYCPEPAAEPTPTGPDLSCPAGVIHQDPDTGNWYCGSECEICEERRAQCSDILQRARRDCVENGRAAARTSCTPFQDVGVFDWAGRRLNYTRADLECSDVTRQDPVTGQMRVVRSVCSGPQVDSCVEGYIVSHPNESVQKSISGSATISTEVSGKAGVPFVAEGEVKVGASVTAGAGKSWSSGWGGGTGIGAACATAMNSAAGELCPPCTRVCSQ